MTDTALTDTAARLESNPCPHCQQDGSVQAEVVRNWLDAKAVRIIAFCNDCGKGIDPYSERDLGYIEWPADPTSEDLGD